jgi:signal transduction histidine kinase
MHLRSVIHFLLLQFAWLAISAAAGEAPAPITRVADIRLLSREDAAKALPVRISGVCVWNGMNVMVIHDGQMCIWVELRRQEIVGIRDFNPDDCKVGSHVRVDGKTCEGGYGPVIMPSAIRRLGTLPPPAPRCFDMEHLLSGAEDSQWIEIEGVVQEIHPNAPDSVVKMLTLITDGHSCRLVILDGSGVDDDRWVDARVRVRGIFAPDHNGRAEAVALKLLVNSRSDLSLLSPPPQDPFRSQRVALNRLAPFSSEARPWHRKVTSGIVSFADPGNCFFIQEGHTGVRVNSKSINVKPGQRVEVAGFVDQREGFASMKNALVRCLGEVGVPDPVSVTPELLFQSDGNNRGNTPTSDLGARLVSLRGSIQRLDWERTGVLKALWIESGKHVFPAYLPGKPDLTSELTRLWIPGTEVELTGVCELAFGRLDVPNPSLRPVAFHLLLPSPAAMKILRSPPWWNLQRTRMALAAVGSSALLLLLWSWLLRRQVARQTRIIGDKIAAEAVHTENSRIARDLHDDMGAGLTEIAMLSDLALMDRNRPDALTPNLERIFHASREMTQSLDEIVWAVNPVNDPLDKLVAFTGELAQTILSSAGIRCRLEAPAQLPPVSIPSRTRYQLCLAFKEALHNIVKHARARQVHVRTSLHGRTLALEIEDDGVGFDPTPGEPADGLRDGLHNMCLRMRQIGGSCGIQSSPGAGTRIRFETTLDS